MHLIEEVTQQRKSKLSVTELFIVSQHFKELSDYLKVPLICVKFKDILNLFTSNPISTFNLVYFPNVKHQYLYTQNDIISYGIDTVTICYPVDYENFLNYKRKGWNCKIVTYNQSDAKKHKYHISKGATQLCEECFSFESIKSITLPSTIKKIDKSCFEGCKVSCVSISNCKVFKPIVPYHLCKLIEKSKTECSNVIYTKYDKVTYGLTIPHEVKFIESYCFRSDNIKSISFPIGLLTIGSYAFSNCHSLTSLTLSSTIDVLGENCFNDCIFLSRIELSPRLISIPKECFYGCKMLKIINMDHCCLTTIEESAFNNCLSLESIVLPLKVIKLGRDCFANCSKLQSIQFNDELLEISDGCFSLCHSLSTIHLPTKLTSLGDYTFNRCHNLLTVTIPNSLISIGNYCFYCCSYSLENVIIGDGSLKQIGSNAFFSL
ncbi:Leucine rich repeat containing protein BspA family protein [Entamoeba marina]